MRNKAEKLGLEDLGIYKNHKCVCGADIRLGKDADGQTWSWCKECRKKLNIIFYPRFPKRSFIKSESHTD